ncbi:hypothetical protein L596_025013 [Steinernema carpocapsae]|uniref:Uncharacterized protein n=1 Tax=Steinernema carpocapsae TaxID=34508 RepID=A0A4U5M6I9_STECR|nr:hypothetical protein L596_025013 [Steinernema carpocapsae]
MRGRLIYGDSGMSTEVETNGATKSPSPRPTSESGSDDAAVVQEIAPVEAEAPKRGRGRPRKGEEKPKPAPAPKTVAGRRGRPAKVPAKPLPERSDDENEISSIESPSDEDSEPLTKKRRGRPPKTKAAGSSSNKPTGRPRGRPRKNTAKSNGAHKDDESSNGDDRAEFNNNDEEEPVVAKRGRGRPKKNAA